MTRARLTAPALLAGLALTLTGGCSLGARQSMADRVTGSARRAEAAGEVRGSLSVRVEVLRTRLPVAPGPPKIVAVAATDLATILEFKVGRAAVGVPGDDPANAALMFDGSRVFERKDVKVPAAIAGAASNVLSLVATAGPPATSGQPDQPGPAGQLSQLARLVPVPTTTTTTTTAAAPPSTGRLRRPVQIQRRWLALDYGSLPRRDSNKTAGSFAISPVVIEHLVVGALTGSVRQLGTEVVDGTTAVHYKMNVSRDKAERGLSDAQRRDLDKIFRANAIGARVFPAEAWLDQAGVLRRVAVTLRQSLGRIDRADLRITLDLHPVAVPVPVPLPDPKQTVIVQNLGQLVHGAAGA
jgi:hypothetical protein